MTSNSIATSSSSSYPSMDLKGLCNTIMNTDARVRFVGILDNKNAKLVEGGMRKNVPSLLHSGKDELFFLRIVSQLNQLKEFRETLGDISYVFVKMNRLSFVSMSLKKNMTLLVSMEPDTDPSFIIPTIRNSLIE
jgi:hypothetical protein